MGPAPSLDLDRLLKLRLGVARYGEQDVMAWWSTKNALGSLGKMAYRRGFPRTASFARARAVFAVAGARCRELWNPPGCATLWSMPPGVEAAFEDRWQDWLDEHASWEPFFDALASVRAGDLLDTLVQLGALTAAEAESATELRRSADGRAVALPGERVVDDETVGLLAAGFFRGEVQAPAVPYARLERRP